MPAPLSAPPLKLTKDPRAVLERFSRWRTLAHRTVLQAKALLLAADGVANYEIA